MVGATVADPDATGAAATTFAAELAAVPPLAAGAALAGTSGTGAGAGAVAPVGVGAVSAVA